MVCGIGFPNKQVYTISMERCVRHWRIGCQALFAALILFTGCTENSNLFNSLDEPDGPQLDTVVSGSVVSPFVPFSMQLTYPDEETSRVTNLLVQLQKPNGEVAGEIVFLEDDLLEPELPKFELDQFEMGPYSLVVEAMRGEEFLFRDERQIFILSESPVIRGVAVYPSTIRTNAQAVAVADIVGTAYTRPYVKWYFGESLIGEGYVEDGFQKIVFSPGEDAGVHTMAVDLFPWGPDEGVIVDDRTSISSRTDVFIRADVPARDYSENALLVYPLNGRLDPTWDQLSQNFESVMIGDDVILDVEMERLGYRVPSDRSITIPYDIMPANGDARRLSVRVANKEVDGELIISFTDADSSSLKIPVGFARDGVFDIPDRLEIPIHTDDEAEVVVDEPEMPVDRDNAEETVLEDHSESTDDESNEDPVAPEAMTEPVRNEDEELVSGDLAAVPEEESDEKSDPGNSREMMDQPFPELPSNDPGWLTVSVLLIRQDDQLVAILEVPGQTPEVATLFDIPQDTKDTYPVLTFRGEGSLLVEYIEVVETGRAAEYFSARFASYLYHERGSMAGPSLRATVVDLAREEIVVHIPKDHLFLWTSSDGISQFILSRTNEVVHVYDPGPDTRPERISGTLYSEFASGEVSADTVVIQYGPSFDVSADGIVTIPASVPSRLLAVSISLLVDSDPAFLASIFP